MAALVYVGTGLALIGMLTLGYCIWAAVSAKRSGLADAELRASLQRIVTINMGALLVSVLGLISVVMGIFLG
jgi:tetrahydromethanopterin S-methyltransferase subunit C